MDALSDALADKTPAWIMRTMLAAMRVGGMDFESAWSSAIQRIRVAPNMDQRQADELALWKEWLRWAKPWYEWAYIGANGRPPLLPPPPDHLASPELPGCVPTCSNGVTTDSRQAAEAA